MWLTREGDVLASLESDRRLLDGTFTGALILRPPALVHTFRPAMALDVAWCARGPEEVLEVRRTAALKPWRISRPCVRAAAVVAPSGSFERWHLGVGDRLEAKGG
ncbi:MAG TPA: hypothetical protein VKU91_08215 [Acidimicrobiales bacterium]|nr:hypothetical protein [Acidimicrobiales bacterium]